MFSLALTPELDYAPPRRIHLGGGFTARLGQHVKMRVRVLHTDTDTEDVVGCLPVSSLDILAGHGLLATPLYHLYEPPSADIFYGELKGPNIPEGYRRWTRNGELSWGEKEFYTSVTNVHIVHPFGMTITAPEVGSVITLKGRLATEITGGSKGTASGPNSLPGAGCPWFVPQEFLDEK